MIEMNPKDLQAKEIYKLLTGSVVPRPIAWVSTISLDGQLNLAPFSFFTVASRKPPILCFSIGPGVEEREGTEKDTLVNIRTQKEFVINVVPAVLGEQMQKSARNFPSEVNEFEAAGLTPMESKLVKPMRVKEAPIHMECVLHSLIPLGNDHLVLGEMIRYHIDDDHYMGNYKIDLEKLKPLGRLAGNYSEMHDLFKLGK